jgi:membrane associated rhomboid family serine protease
MILPIRTSIVPRRTPYANYALIAVNAAIFLLTYHEHRNPFTGDWEALRPWAEHFMLIPVRPDLWQFVSYAFLHGSYMHIFGNMFFLYLFGNNVNDKLGTVGYLCFYLAGAVFSGIGHTLLNPAPVLGASGAVAAVTGAYLVLFPQTLITVIYWFFFIGTIEISALYFIAFKMIILDNVIIRYTPNVAHDAHLAGYAFGMLAMLGMLATGLISSSHFDLYDMLRQWNRRRRYRDVVSSGYDPYSGRTARRIKVKEVKQTAEQKRQQQEIKQLRDEISRRISQRNLSAATALYLELNKIDSNQVPPRQYLLDIANQLTSENKYPESAAAYEKFLAHYSKYEYIEQVQLMLGILYSRYLNKPSSAIEHLKAAAGKLTDPGQLKMCKEELAKLEN